MRLLLIILLSLTLSSRAAILFDGANDMVGFTAMSDAVFRENSAVTISLWFYANSDGESSAGNFVRRGGNILRIFTPQSVRFTVAGSTTLTRTAVNSSIVLSVWNHLCMTWDGSTTAANVHIYINTAEVGYATTTDGVTPTDNSADELFVGNNSTAVGTFDGQITEVAMWSSVLTTAERSALFYGRIHQMPLQISKSTLQTYWPLDDFSNGATVTGSGTVKDLSGNSRHGTAVNAPVSRAVEITTYP